MSRIWSKICKWAYEGWERRSYRRDLEKYPISLDLLASLSTHPGFQYLCAHIENTRAILQAQKARIKDPPKSMDEMIEATIEAAVLDEHIRSISWLQRQVELAGIQLLSLQAAPQREENE